MVEEAEDDEEENKELDSEEDDVDEGGDEYLAKLAKQVCGIVIVHVCVIV